MTQDLVRAKLEKSLRVKSLGDLIKKEQDATIWLALDVSGSMRECMRNGKMKIDGLREVVKDIETNGVVKKIAFGGIDGNAYVVHSIPNAAGGTPLHAAIDLAKQQGSQRLIVISDGIPDNQDAAMNAAKRFEGKIDVVYVGDPNDPWNGEDFLRKLAASTGGTEFTGDLSQPKELAGQIMGLLGEGSD